MNLKSNPIKFSVAAVILWASAQIATSAPPPPTAETALANYDKRIVGRPPSPPVLTPERAVALDQARARIPDIQVDFDPVVASPKWIRSQRGFLTGPKEDPVALGLQAPMAGVGAIAEDPHEPAKRFLNEHAALFGHGAEALTNARITREFVTERTGLRTIVWQQEVDGIPVFQGALIAHITRNGELVNMSSLFLPAPEQATRLDQKGRAALVAVPPVPASQAIVNAADSVGHTLTEEDVNPQERLPQTPPGWRLFAVTGLNGTPRAQLTWLPTDRASLRLCWQVELTISRQKSAYRTLVDATTGDVLLRHCLTKSGIPAWYRVFVSDSPSPKSPGYSTPTTQQPDLVDREFFELTALDGDASPNGWVNAAVNGVYTTIGNNVDAQQDSTDDDLNYNHPLGVRPSPPSPVFDYSLNLPTDDPIDYLDASIVQLFYWCNWMHDRLYQLGFTESAGNFQFDNFDRGGMEGDPVMADAQDSCWGTFGGHQPPVFNGGHMSTSVDGFSPRLEIHLDNGPDPWRDSSLDAEVVLHEYAHGLSDRRVGGGGGMTTSQANGLGEGWGDFMALALLSEEFDNVNGNYAAGAYSAYQFYGLTENYYYGFGRYPYTTDMLKNPLTFKDIDPEQAILHEGVPISPLWAGVTLMWADEVHFQGELWCAALWEARAKLVQKYGHAVGNNLMVQLAVDGMNLCSANPTFVQARDAVLQAARVLGFIQQDIDLLWDAFAKRGLGYSAAAPGSETTIGVVEAFDLPTPGELWTFSAGSLIYSSPALGVDGTIYFGTAAGKLYALNADGSLKWQFSATNSISASPSVGPDGCIYFGCTSGKFYVLNPDGTLKWTFTAGGPIHYSSAAIGSDGTVYFGCLDDRLYALNSDGTPQWTFPTGGDICSSPAIDKDGVIYVGSYDRKLYAINPGGTVKWPPTTVGDIVFSSPAINPATGRIIFGSYDGKIYVLNASNGQIVSQFQTGGSVRSSPVLDVQGNIYIGSLNGSVYSLDPDGNLRWSHATGSYLYSAPAIGWDGRVFVASYDRKLYVLKSDGSEIKSFLTGAEFYSSPVVGVDGRLYIGGRDSKLYAFPAETLLAPSFWPMFRRDPRHLANQGFMQLDGALLLDNHFRLNGHSSVYPAFAQLQWSDDLTEWHDQGVVSFIDSGFGTNAPDWYVSDQQTRIFVRLQGNAPYTSVRSGNPYGFIKLTVPPGNSMFGNPLNTRVNTLSGLMPDVPDGTTFFKWNDALQQWDNPCSFITGLGWLSDTSLLPGEGGLIQNYSGEPFTVTFIGEVLQGHLTKPIPAGLSIQSSMVPQEGGITTVLGFGPEDGLAAGDKLHRYENPSASYLIYTYDGADWHRTTPPPSVLLEPAPTVAEAFWIQALGARNWKRTFSVWQ